MHETAQDAGTVARYSALDEALLCISPLDHGDGIMLHVQACGRRKGGFILKQCTSVKPA